MSPVFVDGAVIGGADKTRDLIGDALQSSTAHMSVIARRDRGIFGAAPSRGQ